MSESFKESESNWRQVTVYSLGLAHYFKEGFSFKENYYCIDDPAELLPKEIIKKMVAVYVNDSGKYSQFDCDSDDSGVFYTLEELEALIKKYNLIET